MNSTSFWNNDKIDKNSSSAPLKIMVEQANSLSTITNEYLIGQVITNSNGDKSINYCFTIIAPYLNQSRLTLFCIDQELDKEFPLNFYSDYFPSSDNCSVCNDLDSFNKCLKNIISSDKVSELINGLIAKSSAVNQK